METWLAVFTGIVAVAFILQSIAFIGLYRSVRSLSTRLDIISKDLMGTVTTLAGDIGQAMVTVKEVLEGMQSVREKLVSTADIVQKRISELDYFLRDITDVARLEVARIQDAVDNAARQMEDTFELLHRGIITPVMEATAIIRGLRAGIDFFLHRPRTPSGASHLDEEMFIG